MLLGTRAPNLIVAVIIGWVVEYPQNTVHTIVDTPLNFEFQHFGQVFRLLLIPGAPIVRPAPVTPLLSACSEPSFFAHNADCRCTYTTKQLSTRYPRCRGAVATARARPPGTPIECSPSSSTPTTLRWAVDNVHMSLTYICLEAISPLHLTRIS